MTDQPTAYCPACGNPTDDGTCWCPECPVGAANIDAAWADAEVHARGDAEAERYFERRRERQRDQHDQR